MLSAPTLPFFRLVLFYIGGISLACCYQAALYTTLVWLAGLSMLYLARIGSSATTFPWLNPIVGLFLIVLLGYSNLLLQIAQQQATKSIERHQPIKGYAIYIEKVYDPLSCKALITQIKDQAGWHNSHTSIQLYFSKKCNYAAKKGDRLMITGPPSHIVPSKQMEQAEHDRHFHGPVTYRHVLQKIDQDFNILPSQQLHHSGQWRTTFIQWCEKTLHKQLQSHSAIALVSALLWGEKEGLNPALQKAYAATGTIHVLAISGLHVSMFYLLAHAIFRSVFSSIGYLVLSDLFSLVWLWLYAWLCHFSPPIVRATVMITMARLGFLMGRGSNSYHGLLVSGFMLLTWNPLVLCNCGFQLSYLATLGILYMQPYIYRLITPKNYWLEKLWSSTTLSIAAQVATLPLILYYFKQFPLYFILANWLVVPAIFMILMFSLALLLASHLPIVNTLLSVALEKLIHATNEWVCLVAKWPLSSLSTGLVNGPSVWLLYTILLATCLFLQYKKFVYLIVISLCTTYYTVNQIQYIISKQKICQLICYNNHRLSFTLKDGIELLSSDRPPPNRWLLRHYNGGTITTWYGKVILSIGMIPTDWHGWDGAKLPVDYLLMEENLLRDIATICKVLEVKTWVIYARQARRLGYYHAYFQKLGMKIIWLKPDEKRSLAWPKNHHQ